MKNILITLILTAAALCCSNAQAAIDPNATRVVGGDLSLVPAYEDAGDQWLDANGKVIADMIDFVKNTCGWNAVRVRLFVEPGKDLEPATCQDIDYVKALGKRIKDAGMYFLLDIHYSDTWADVGVQAIPASWNMTRNTSNDDIAQKVYEYTKEVLQTLNGCDASPDYVQVGNEVSYGMLWDTCTYSSTAGTTVNKAHACYPSQAFNTYSAQWTRFAQLLKNGAAAVREECPDAKIVLHSERTINANYSANFYRFVEQAGFTDYDVIGLSYYPFWHGTLTQLQSTLSTLISAFPDKEIQIVETGYNNGSGNESNGTNMSSYWAYSPDGQEAFLNDLIGTLKTNDNVTGLYYWQPEECGNGADSNGINRVMGAWDCRGFWQLTWKSGTHALTSKGALMALKDFPHTDIGGGNSNEPIDASGYFTNLDFEQSAAPALTGWSVGNLGLTNAAYAKAVSQWESPLVNGLMAIVWNDANSPVSAGNIIEQSAAVPNGEYTISVIAHADQQGAYVFANKEKTALATSSTWSAASSNSVTVDVTDGYLTIGICMDALNSSSQFNLYADNFKVTYIPAANVNRLNGDDTIDANTLVDVFDMSGRTIRHRVAYGTCTRGLAHGIYIVNGKKVAVK